MAALSMNFLFNQLRDYVGSLSSGTVEFCQAGTLTPATIWLDHLQTQVAANPYMLSVNGTAELFGNGTYHVIVRNSDGVIVYDYDYVEIIPTSGVAIPVIVGQGSSHYVAPCQTGTFLTSELTNEYHQYWTRTGDSLFPAIITLPAGTTFYNGLSDYRMYADGETMGFLLRGTVYYPVGG